LSYIIGISGTSHEKGAIVSQKLYNLGKANKALLAIHDQTWYKTGLLVDVGLVKQQPLLSIRN